MGFVKDKIIAPLAGHAAKHTSPGLGHKAVDAVGANKVVKAMSDYLGPEASVQMMDEAGPEHLADVLGPDHTGELMSDMIKLGHPKNKEMMLSVGPQRLAAMLKRLGPEGAVQVGAGLSKSTPANQTAEVFSNLGTQFVGALMVESGSALAGAFLRGMGPQYAASVFKLTGPDFLAHVFLIMKSNYAGLVLAAAGVDCDAALFNHLGPEFAASFMHTTGAQYQADMLKALGVDNSTKLFELAGAPFVAALLKSLGPDFNALLVTDLGKGAVLLGIDLGASFLAEVATHSEAGFLASTLAATTGNLVSLAADAIADSLNLKGDSASFTPSTPLSSLHTTTTTSGAPATTSGLSATTARHSTTGTTTSPVFGVSASPVTAVGSAGGLMQTASPTVTTNSSAGHSSHTHLLHKQHHYGVDSAMQHQPVLQTVVTGPVGQGGGAAVPAAVGAVAAAPAGAFTGSTVGEAVSASVKEFVAQHSTQTPTRVTMRPTHALN